MKLVKKLKYKKVACKDYNIYLINNKGLHNIEFSIHFTENVNRQKITYRNVLADLLTSATKNYNTFSKLTRKCIDLYSIYPKSSVNRCGNLLRTKFSISILDSCYVNKSIILDNIRLIKEIILNPLRENNKFNQTYLEVVKKQLATETESIEENTRLYANIKLLESFGKDKNFCLTGFCDLNLLNELTDESLYASYLEMLKESRIDFFIAGNITNEKEIIETIQKEFAFERKMIPLKSPIFIHEKDKKIEYLYEKTSTNQSKLSMAYKTIGLTEKENKMVLGVFNTLFGGGATSLLNKNVREKNNLCYYINSYYNKLDNILIINSGISSKNYKLTVELIEKTLKDIINGHFTKCDLAFAKAELLSEIARIEDGNNNLIEYCYGLEIFNSDDLETKKAIIKAITKEEIMKVAKKVYLSKTFLLAGGEYENI